MANRIQRNTVRLVSMALFAAVLLHRGAEAAELKVCIDKSSPSAQMDLGVARAIGHLRGEAAKVSWFDGQGDDDDGLSARKLRKLASGCELVLGFPVDAQSPALPDGVSATQPYARTGFVLVTRKRAPASLDQLPKDSVVAVTYMTAPNLYFASYPTLSPQVFISDAESLRAVSRGKVAGAMLWRPYVARHLGDKAAGGLKVSALAEPHADWNLVALYVDGSQAAARQFEQDIEQLRLSGQLQRLLQPYAEAPLPHTASGTAINRPTRLTVQQWPAARLIAVAEKKPSGAAKAPPALYTDTQADAGKQVFLSNCAVCHGPNLEGRSGPTLKGPAFATPQAHFSVGDIFKIVSQNMPAPAPGTLPHDDYVNVMSFLLQQNGYPSGTTPLTFESAGKSRVKLIYHQVQSN